MAELRDYFRAREEVSAAFLFGSQARGDAGPGSDLDFAVLLDREKATAFPGRAQVITDLMGLCGRDDIDLVVLNGAAPLVQHRVLRDGYVLFSRDSRTLAEFTIRAFQEYVDTKPLRELQVAQLRRWIARETQRPESHASDKPLEPPAPVPPAGSSEAGSGPGRNPGHREVGRL